MFYNFFFTLYFVFLRQTGFSSSLGDIISIEAAGGGVPPLKVANSSPGGRDQRTITKLGHCDQGGGKLTHHSAGVFGGLSQCQALTPLDSEKKIGLSLLRCGVYSQSEETDNKHLNRTKITEQTLDSDIC